MLFEEQPLTEEELYLALLEVEYEEDEVVDTTFIDQEDEYFDNLISRCDDGL